MEETQLSAPLNVDNDNNTSNEFIKFNYYYKLLGTNSVFYSIPAIRYVYLQIHNKFNIFDIIH